MRRLLFGVVLALCCFGRAEANPPTVNAGGPYTTVLGIPVVVSATGTNVEPNITLTNGAPAWEWEIDGGGSSQRYAYLQKLAVETTTAGTINIRVRARNSSGVSAWSATTITTNPLPTVFNGGVTNLASNGDLQAALNAAADSQVANGHVLINLPAGATYTGNFVLKSRAQNGNWIFIKTAGTSIPTTIDQTRVSQSATLARIVSPNSQPALKTQVDVDGVSHYGLFNVELTGNGSGDVQYGFLRLGTSYGWWGEGTENGSQATYARRPHHILVGGNLIHGGTADTTNYVRGIDLNAVDVGIFDNQIYKFRGTNAQGAEDQAISAINGAENVRITNNYLESGGEVMIFGGSGPGIRFETPVTAAMATTATITTPAGCASLAACLEVGDPISFMVGSTRDISTGTVITGIAGNNVTFAALPGGGTPNVSATSARFGAVAGKYVTIRKNFLNYPTAWAGTYSHKNDFELKNARNVVFDGNVCRNSYGPPNGGQGGAGIVITVRSQDTTSEWSTIRNVQFSNSKVLDVAGGIRFLNRDNLSGNRNVAMRDVLFVNNLFTIDHDNRSGGEAGQWMSLQGQTNDVAFNHNTVVQYNYVGRSVSVSETSNNIVMANNIFSHGDYGFTADGQASITGTISNHMLNSHFARNIVMRRGQSQTSAPNQPASFEFKDYYSDIFVNFAAGNYTLTAGSGLQGTANDGTDPGVNFGELEAKTSGAESGDWSGSAQSPFGGSPAAVPGTIKAADFDNGGEGVAYHDTTPGNQSASTYRATDVDMYNDSVNRLHAGEWLEYTVNVAAGGTYAIVTQVGSDSPGGKFHIEVDGTDVTGQQDVPYTTLWASWTSVVKTGVPLTAGPHVIRLAVDADFGGLQSIRVVDPAVAQSPYGGTAPSVPLTISAADFDEGGEQVSYHDNTAGCDGTCARSADVDTYNNFVRATSAGEWLEYTINVPSAGAYNLGVEVASDGGGGTFHVEIGGVDVTGPLAIPDTTNYAYFQTVTTLGVSLTAGQKVMRLVVDDTNDRGNTYLASFRYLTLGQGAAWQNADVGAVGYAGGASYTGGSFTVNGSGNDIWWNADGFHYVYQQKSGDCEVVARVETLENTDASAKAGVMIRESTAADSKHVILNVKPSGDVEFMRRDSGGGMTDYLGGSGGALPRWLKLVRSGNTFTAYLSGDGVNWSPLGSTTVSMSGTVRVGLAVTAHDNTELSTATFSGVSVN